MVREDDSLDVLSVIKREHREVSALFDEAEKCKPGDARVVELAHEIQDRLAAHLSIEERLFYGPLRRRAEEREQEVDMFEAYTEHEVARHLMQMLKTRRKPDERFKAELAVLAESVKHHVQEEESKVFGIAREIMEKAELDAIGEAWEISKRRAVSRSASARNGVRKRPTRRSSRKSTRS
jgi:hemerythrin-like domain-containing protein